MRNFLIAGACALALNACAAVGDQAGPALDWIKAELNEIDAKLTEMLEDKTPVEDAFAWAGDQWKDLCDKVDGEWVADDDRELSPGKCEKDARELF